MKSPDITIRPMRVADLPAVIAIQNLCYGATLVESAANFRARFNRFGEYFRVAQQPETGMLYGYVLCFPWRLGEIPKHNQPFAEILPAPDCFYLHDIAVHPQAKGQGIAKALLSQVYSEANAQGFACISLVAVAQSGQYWDKQGFLPLPGQGAERQAYITANYGAGARLMTHTRSTNGAAAK